MYRKVFVPNPNFRFDVNQLSEIAKEVVYTCDLPMFDDLMGDEHIDRFEHKIAERLSAFDPKKDVVAFYGDSMIFALMIMWLSENFDSFDVARFSTKKNSYLIRNMSHHNFDE